MRLYQAKRVRTECIDPLVSLHCNLNGSRGRVWYQDWTFGLPECRDPRRHMAGRIWTLSHTHSLSLAEQINHISIINVRLTIVINGRRNVDLCRQ